LNGRPEKGQLAGLTLMAMVAVAVAGSALSGNRLPVQHCAGIGCRIRLGREWPLN